MKSLNQYGSHIANLLGRPADHVLIEMAKESIKGLFNNRIRQSIAKNGIDYNFVITCELPIVLDTETSIPGFTIFKTTNLVPKSVRFANDSPYIRVSCNNFNDYNFSVRSDTEIRLARRSDTKGFTRYYVYENGTVRLYINTSYEGLVIKTDKISKVYLTGIFEDPEEVMAMYSSEDSQDLPLPFPADMIEAIILELLKTEFALQRPPETEIKA